MVHCFFTNQTMWASQESVEELVKDQEASSWPPKSPDRSPVELSQDDPWVCNISWVTHIGFCQVYFAGRRWTGTAGFHVAWLVGV